MAALAVLATLLAVAGGACPDFVPGGPNATALPSCQGARSHRSIEAGCCCPTCCRTAHADRCGTCSAAACLNATEPPWSRAYSNQQRRSFVLVVQRPFAWTVPAMCHCGTATAASVANEGAPSRARGSRGFEEGVTRMAGYKSFGCCDGGDTWRTRSLRCVFDTRCDAEALELGDERVSVTEIPPVDGAQLCLGRLDSDPDGNLPRWLQHHRERDIAHVVAYSDSSVGLGLLEHHADVDAIDVRPFVTYPGWYHHQLLGMKDCHARAVAAGATWVVFIDRDEALMAPPGWSTAAAFDRAAAISFGSVRDADHDQHPCRNAWRGHRKYALRVRGVDVNAPGYIHGDPRALVVNVSSGVFVAHVDVGGARFAPLRARQAELGALVAPTTIACPAVGYRDWEWH